MHMKNKRLVKRLSTAATKRMVKDLSAFMLRACLQMGIDHYFASGLWEADIMNGTGTEATIKGL